MAYSASPSLVLASSSRLPIRLLVRSQLQIPEPRCNHRGAETKKNVAGLMQCLFGYNPFLDEKTMKPGENMPDTIDHAIGQSKMSIAIFSPRYCESIRCQFQIPKPLCNVFINHRVADTKKNLASLLYDYLRLFGYHSFLDEKTMKPGENMPDTIDHAIGQSKMSIAVFSPRYCESIRFQLQISEPLCNVFINHRGVDTKKNVAGLLHGYLRLFGYHPFLDEKTMKPGEKMPDTIDHSIRHCKMSIAVFSPRYCESIHCLNELILMLEPGKRLLPIFVDIKPSELMVGVLGKHPHAKQFHWAIKEAINTVGLTFNSSSGDWPKLLRDALEAVEWNFRIEPRYSQLE